MTTIKIKKVEESSNDNIYSKKNIAKITKNTGGKANGDKKNRG